MNNELRSLVGMEMSFNKLNNEMMELGFNSIFTGQSEEKLLEGNCPVWAKTFDHNCLEVMVEIERLEDGDLKILEISKI